MGRRKKPIISLSAKKREKMEEYHQYWIHDILEAEMDSLDSVLVLYLGPRGGGKSYAAIQDALKIDPEFSLGQICFYKADIDDAIAKYGYQGRKVVVWEEYGAEMLSRDWYKELHKRIVRKLQVIRKTGISLFLTLPHIKFGDTAAENLSNLAIEIQKPGHKDDCYREGKALQPHGFYSDRKPMSFRVFYLEGKIWHVPYLDPVPQHPRLFDEYEKMKDDYIEEQETLEKEEEGWSITRKKLRIIELRNAGVSQRGIVDQMKQEGFRRITRNTVRWTLQKADELGMVTFKEQGQKIPIA